jgi:hypothetical protein
LKIKLGAEFGDRCLSLGSLAEFRWIEQPVRQHRAADAGPSRAKQFEKRSRAKEIQIGGVGMALGLKIRAINSAPLPLVAQAPQAEFVKTHDPLHTAMEARILRKRLDDGDADY